MNRRSVTKGSATKTQLPSVTASPSDVSQRLTMALSPRRPLDFKPPKPAPGRGATLSAPLTDRVAHAPQVSAV